MQLLFISGCGYRFTAESGTRLQAGQKVWVPFFSNSTVYSNAQVALKRALFDQFAEQRGILPASSPKGATLLVEGVLTGYGVTAVSYSAADQIREYRLTLTANLQVSQPDDKKGAVVLWKGEISAWQDYPVSATVEQQRSSEEAALQTASRKLAEQLIWNLEQGY